MNGWLKRGYCLLLAACSLLLIQCEESGTFNPGSPDVRLAIIVDLTATPNRLPIEGDRSVITGRVIDQYDEPHDSVAVTFSANLGSIIAVDTTDEEGSFSAEYFSGNVTGTDTITVSVLGHTATVNIEIFGATAELSLTTGRVSALANGTDTVTVVAKLVGVEGALNNVRVRYETTAGSFYGHPVIYANTNIEGISEVILTAPSSNSTVFADITATVDDIITEASTQFNPVGKVTGEKRPVKKISEINAEASTRVTFRGVFITVDAAQILIPGDGQSTTTIIAYIKELNRQAIPNATVNFSAMLGTIPFSELTNNAGVAIATLTSADLPGERDMIVAKYGPELADTVYVDYAAAVSEIHLSAAPSSILADGVNTCRITALVIGGTGDPAPDIDVSFSSDLGILESDYAVTDVNGEATVVLISPSSMIDRMITVTGEVISDEPVSSPAAVGLSRNELMPGALETVLPGNRAIREIGKEVQHSSRDDRKRTLRLTLSGSMFIMADSAISDSVIVLAKGVQLNLIVEQDSIIARIGSTTDVVAQLFETTSGNPVTNKTIYFSTTLGSIPSFGLTDIYGQARVELSATADTGRAQIAARFGASHRDSAEVMMLPTIGTLTATPDKRSLLAGGLDETLVRVEVKDALGGSAGGVTVTYEIDLEGEEKRLFTDQDGKTEFTVRSFPVEVDTALHITVSAGSMSEELRLGLRAVTRRISADPDSLSAGDGDPVDILFQAFETQTHRPVVGDTIWFSGVGGVVQPVGVLDQNGFAHTTMQAADEPQTAMVTGQLGLLTPDTVSIELIEPLAELSLTTGRRSILANGIDTTIVIARVSNVLGHPTGDATVQFEVDRGEIIPSIAVTDIDGQASAVLIGPALEGIGSLATIFASVVQGAFSTGYNEDGSIEIDMEQRSDGPLRFVDDSFNQSSRGNSRIVDPWRISNRPLAEKVSSLLEHLPRRDQAEDSTQVILRGISLDLRASPRSVRADGFSTTAVNVHLHETESGTAIADGEVRFGATMGSIRGSGITGDDGTLVDSLRAGITPGVSYISATYGNSITAMDSVRFTPDPNRLSIIFTLDPEEIPADGEATVDLYARVVNEVGAPMEEVAVRFTAEGTMTVFIEQDEYHNVTRWDNSFRVDDPETVNGVSMAFQLRGVDNQNTRIYINRNEIEGVELPQDVLWREAVVELPPDNLAAGVNRISIIGSDEGEVIDRFSVAGVRLGLVGSHLLSETLTDENGNAEGEYTADLTAGMLNLKAYLTENPNAYRLHRISQLPGVPGQVRISAQKDTLFANGVEECDLLALIVDANGNPVQDDHQVSFSVDPEESGTVEPEEASTLADGTVNARFITPVGEGDDLITTLNVACEGASSDINLLLRTPVLRLTVPADRMLANGTSRMTLRARLGTNDGAPIIGRRIDFITTLGSITPVGQTNNEGIAEAVLTSGDSPDTATVRASFGPDIITETDIIFAPIVEALDISSQPASIPGSGLHSNTLSFTLIDGIGDPSVGVWINLENDIGRLSANRVITDENGEASLVLTGVATSGDDTINVTASLAQGNIEEIIRVPVNGISVTVTADADSLPGNGTATAQITARIAEATSGVPMDTGRVYFVTDLGTIAGGADLSEDGIATATFTAPLDVGSATIRGQYGLGLYDETVIDIIDRVSEIDISIDPGSILANGIEESEIVVTVSDPWGDPAPRQRVNISFEGPGTVEPTVGLTDDNGILNVTAIGEAVRDNGLMIITADTRNGELSAQDTLELRGVTIDLDVSLPLIPGDGESTTTVTAHVRETATGHAVSGESVYFASTAGVIAASVRLDETGRAATLLTSDDEPAIAIVTATYGNELIDTAEVAFASRFSYLETRLGRLRLLADGMDTTRIAAILHDTLGNPSEGVYVHFEVLNDLGELSADSTVTNQNGIGSATFISEASQDDIDAELRIFVGELADTLTLSMRGITVELSIEPENLPANGRAEATVTASVVQTTSGNPIIGGTLFFAIENGEIEESSVTDNRGRATVYLTAPEEPGDVIVTVSFGQTLTAEATITFVEVAETVEVEAEADQLLGDGLSSVDVTATVSDEIGNPASGITVTFTVQGGGEIDPEQAVTQEDGVARATYTGIATRDDISITIEAETETEAFGDAAITLLGITTRITASPGRLSANGRSTAVIRFSAQEATAHTPVTDLTVNFSADRGTIGRSAVLDSNGVATIMFTAPSEAGDALIQAVIGDTLITALTLPCIESIPVYAELSVEPAAVSVAGVGRTQSARLTAIITDDDQQIVPDGSVITFRITGDIGVHFAEDLDTIAVETEEGIARASVTSGEDAGSVSFEVLYGDHSLAFGGELLVLAGPASRISVHADLGTIHHPGGELSAFPISATVADRFSNPVEDSTAVRFYLVPNDLAQITALGYTRSGVISTPIQPIDYHEGIWLTYADENAGEEVWIHASSSGGAAHDSTRVILPGAVEGGEPDHMEIGVAQSTLDADGFSGTEITARIFDADDQAVADMTEVTLTASLGSVQSPRNTANGEISSIYRAGRVAGVDWIIVTAGEVTDSVFITLRPGAPATIELTAEDDEIRANGVQFTDIVATVRDRFGNLVVPSTVVRFSTELGEIADQALTDESGQATARLYSGMETGLTLIGAVSGDASAQTSVLFISGDADGIILYSIDREYIGVRGSGAPETVTLIFEIRDDRGVPVDADHFAQVEFRLEGPAQVIDPEESSEDSVAYLEPETTETDERGRAAVTLNAGYFAGAVEITATIGDDIAGQAISVAIHGGPPDQNHFSLMTERCVITGIYGTPVDTTSLWANVGDRFSNPTIPGTVVRFSSSGGVISGSARTDSLGRCGVLLTSSNPWPNNGVDTITAQTVDWNDEEIIAQTIVLVTGPTRISFEPEEDWEIPFGSYQNFVITVADTFGHPLVAGSTVLIEAEGRNPQGEEVDGIVLTGDATEEEYELQECGQRSRFFVRVFNYVSGLNGANIELSVTVFSPNGDVTASLTGRALGQVLSVENSSVVLSPDEIIADGEDECTVDITLYDIGGIAIPTVPPDMVVVTVDGGNPLVTPPDAPSDDEGRLSATIVGRDIGQGTVNVSVGGELLNDQPTLYFVPGPPARMLIQVLDRQLVVGGDTTSVIVEVTDQSGNPTADGTVVIFETSDGSFNPVSTTTVDGSTVSLFSSGQTAGEAGFSVTASRRGGVVEEEVTNLLFIAGPPETFSFTAESYIVQVGSQLDIEIACMDEFGNSVAQNTAFSMSVSPVDNGSVAPAVVRADEEGRATVTFTAGTTAGDTAHVIAASGGATGSSPVFIFAPGPPGRISLSANPDNAEVGTEIDLTADIEDAYGNPVSDTTRVTFSRDPELGSLTPSVVNSSNGTAISVLSGVRQAGDIEVIAQAGEVTASDRVTFTVGELSQITVTATPNLVQVDRSSEIRAVATDRFGNPVPDMLLNFELTTNPGNSCVLQHAQRRTGNDGAATTIFTAGDSEGSAIITVSWDDDANIEGSTYVDVELGQGG